MLRFVNKIKWCLLRCTEDHEERDELNASNLDQAESLLIRTVQANAFRMRAAICRKDVKWSPTALYFDDNQVSKCSRRMNNSSLQPESKHPILLPSSHPFVELLIHQTHERVKHSAVNNTLATIWEKFWILQGRQAVKRVLRHCMICKKLEGLSYPASYSPDLPNIPVSDDPLPM